MVLHGGVAVLFTNQRAVSRSPSFNGTGGRQSGPYMSSDRVDLKGGRELVERCKLSLPMAAIFSQVTSAVPGTAAGRPMPVASSRINSGSEMSSPSDTKCVAWCVFTLVKTDRSRSERFRTPISERRPSTDASGNGSQMRPPEQAPEVRFHTRADRPSGGRTTRLRSPFRWRLHSPDSASSLEIAYGSAGSGGSS